MTPCEPPVWLRAIVRSMIGGVIVLATLSVPIWASDELPLADEAKTPSTHSDTASSDSAGTTTASQKESTTGIQKRLPIEATQPIQKRESIQPRQ